MTAVHTFISVTCIYRVLLIRAFTLKLYVLWNIRVILRAVSLIPTNVEFRRQATQFGTKNIRL